MRDGRWKLHFAHDYRSVENGSLGRGGLPGKVIRSKTSEELYDLENDPGERNDVFQQHPEIVKRLKQLADTARQDLGDKLTNIQGSGNRSAGILTPINEFPE